MYKRQEWELPALSEVLLGDNQITCIKDLAKARLPALKRIDLSHNQITDLSTLAGTELPELRGLGLTHNQISDISVFTEVNLPNLSALGLSCNQITNLSSLADVNLTSLKYLDLEHNQIMDLSGLADSEFPELDSLCLRLNYLNINHGSPARNIIDDFIAKDIYVRYEPQRPFYGDIDINEVINVTDATILVLRHVAGLTVLTPEQLIRAKVFNEETETLTIQDAIFILRHIVGLINQFPVQ